jgi:glycosyltransferase involved in cell wall biosynthesis/predicted metal-dependent phosphoesterase TrpH
MTLRRAIRVDLHCHSSASQLSKLGARRALGLPECVTTPEEVLALATRRGMDFVTITDHDTIAGVLQIVDDPRVFVSVELTAWFAGERQAVHVLCWGITPTDHEWLQANARNLEACAAYLAEREIACGLAHPFHAVAEPLQPRHRARLAELFGVWETRNGSRAHELNHPAVVYAHANGIAGVGGSDDHAGIDIGRTFTVAPPAATPAEFLAHVRAGRAEPGGDEGSAARSAHASMAMAARVLGRTHDGSGEAQPQPALLARAARRLVDGGDARREAMGADLEPAEARALLSTWVDAIGLGAEPEGLIALLQDEHFAHDELYRRACAAHEHRLARAFVTAGSAFTAPAAEPAPADPVAAALSLWHACAGVIPYASATAFLGKERARAASSRADPPRVALIADAVGANHGFARTVGEIRARGVPGFEVEVVGTDASVDRPLPRVAEVDMPFHPGLRVGVPSLPAVVETLADGRYDLVHVCSPGPAGVAALVVGRIMGVPVIGSQHTAPAAAHPVIAAFYRHCARVLSPSRASDDALRAMGVEAERIGRWDRGVDLERFRPALRTPHHLPGPVNVLHAGRLSRERGADLLAEAFLAARARDPRLHFVLAGGGPAEDEVRERLGRHATFLGWLDGEELARAYASADVFLFASRTDTFGQVLLEAQASGLPVVAVAEGGPRSIVEDGVTGVLCPADPVALAEAVVALVDQPTRRAEMGRAARAAMRERTWARALGRLADGYRRALASEREEPGRRVA